MSLEVSKIYISAETKGEQSTIYEPIDSNVIVVLSNGKKYVATFFNYSNIEELRIRHKKSGAYLNGKYFWEKNMVLVENCSRQVVTEVVRHLIDEGDFNEAFRML